jgi:hypothetical protein
LYCGEFITALLQMQGENKAGGNNVAFYAGFAEQGAVDTQVTRPLNRNQVLPDRSDALLRAA